jgi:hypothetical protein
LFLAPDAIDGRIPSFTVGLDGRFVGFSPLICADDAEAIEKAKRLVVDRSIELWSGPRFVIRLEPNKTRPQNGTEQLSAPSSLLAQSRNRYAASIHPDLPEMQPPGRRDDAD